AKDGDTDFAGEGHFFADTFGDVAGDIHAVGIVHVVRVDDHAHLAPCLNGKRATHTAHACGNGFELFEALDVFFQRFATGTRPCTAEGGSCHDDGRVRRGGGDVVGVAADGVEDCFAFAALLAEIHADGGVAAFDV